MSLDSERLAGLMSSELDASRQLHALLQQELAALKAQQASDLDALNPAKNAAVGELQQAAGARLHFMKTHGLPLNKSCLDHDAMQQSARLQSLWQDLAAQYDANQILSEQLSELVLGLRFRTEQKLKILRARENDPHLYNQKGLASAHGTGSTSIEA